MDEKQAKQLREPFPPSAIGKLPKGGVQLDYVGHAATTDRLLAVDKEWSWEPFAVDDTGLPALDKRGNLWIRLTVAGVTRIGVGDGGSAKECIGDAIRNAAMRFGVALDLWAREDLHEIAKAVEPPDPMTEAKFAVRDAWLLHHPVFDKAQVADAYVEWAATPFADATVDELQKFAYYLTDADEAS